MTRTQAMPFLAPFFTSLAGALIFHAILRAAEVHLSASAWHAVSCGAFLGLGLGLRTERFRLRLGSGVIFAALLFGLAALLPKMFEFAARLAPAPDWAMFSITAVPPLALFFIAGRLLPPFGSTRPGGAAAAALCGVLVAELFQLFLLEGRVSALPIVGAVALAALAAAAAGVSGVQADERAGAGGAGQTAPRGARVAAFFAGAALSGAYPVARKVLLQLAPSTAATDTMILGTALLGALLGVLFICVFFSSPQNRSGAGLLGMIAFAGGMYFLTRELAYTQDMREFADFRAYIGRLHAEYFAFAPDEMPLYLALIGLPSFAAGQGLCGLRGAWRWLLLGLGTGGAAGAGLFPWTESAGGVVFQAAASGAIAAVACTLGVQFQRDPSPPRGWRLAALPAAAVLLWFVVAGAIRFESHEYPDIPIRGEVELLLFAPAVDGDLRVTTSAEDRALIRVNADYVYFNRGIESVAELAGRMPRIFGFTGDCLVAGPLAPILAPLVDSAAARGDSKAARTLTAVETVPVLRPAVRPICEHEGLQAVPDSGAQAPSPAVFFLDHAGRYDNIVFLPPFDASSVLFSTEVIEPTAERLGEHGRLWLYLDTTASGAAAVAAAAAAMASHFDDTSLWAIDDGLLPPFILCLGCKGGGLDGASVAAGIEREVDAKGVSAAAFRSCGELADFLLADRAGLSVLRRTARPPSARLRLPPGSLDGDPPGWAAVEGLLNMVPPAALELAAGVAAPDAALRQASREHVLDGLMVHRRYRYEITSESDLDWQLFREETDRYREAFRTYPETAIGRRIVKALLPLLFENNELQSIRELILSLTGGPPSDPALRFALGRVSLELLDFADALGHVRAAAAADPFYTEAVLYEGLALFFLDRKEEALQAFNAVLEADPDRAPALKYRAMALYDLGRPEEAAAACRAALDLTPEDAELRSLIMLIEEKMLPPLEEDHEPGHSGHDH